MSDAVVKGSARIIEKSTIECIKNQQKGISNSLVTYVWQTQDLVRTMLRYTNETLFIQDYKALKASLVLQVYRLKNKLQSELSEILVNVVFQGYLCEIQMVLEAELPDSRGKMMESINQWAYEI